MHGIRIGQVYVSYEVSNMWGVVTKLDSCERGVTRVTLYHPIAMWEFHSYVHFMEQGLYYRSPTREAMIDKGEFDDIQPGNPVFLKVHVLAHKDKPPRYVDGDRSRRLEEEHVQPTERRGRTRKEIRLAKLRLQRSTSR